MPSPPQEFGSYRILAPLGSGGMGEVYLAEDVRLHRRVALKVLPGGSDGDDQARKRLLREARAAAALDHPNICTVYDVGEVDGRSFIAMQYIDGETLAARMRRAPLPTGEAVRIAAQIAAALAAAHAQGIVHRDVKPQNVMLSSDGKIKVLDFGLAKLVAPTGEADATATNLTAPSAIAGTIPYMSPEQLRGEPVDARSDAFSFGVVLCELLTGSHPFAAASVAETMSAILVRDPGVDPSKLPGELQRIVSRLLEKDRSRRYQSMSDVASDLGNLAGRGQAAPRRRSRLPFIAGIAAAAVIVVAAAAVRSYLGSARSGGPVSEAQLTRVTNFADPVYAPALSPDGKIVAFFRGGADWFLTPGEIYVKTLPDGDAVQITHDPRLKYGPVFSPDGSRVTYTALDDSASTFDWNTYSVPVVGGPSERMLANAAGLTWLDARTVLFSAVEGGGLHMGLFTAGLDRSGERRIYFPVHERAMVHFSWASPDRRWILTVEMDGTGTFERCRIVPFDGSSAARVVGPDGMCIAAAWAPDGRTMYFSAIVRGIAHLWRQRFPDGTPEPITSGSATSEQGIAMAPDGRSLLTSVGQAQGSLWVHTGGADRFVPMEGTVGSARISPDGRRLYCLVIRQPGAPTTLTTVDVASGRSSALLTDFAMIDFDVSRDDRTIVFTTARGHGREVWIASPDGQFAPRRIADSADEPLLSPAGDVVFRALSERQNFLEVVSADGGGRRRIAATPIVTLSRLSADGRWAVVDAAGPGEQARGTLAIEVATGAARQLCALTCDVSWSPDGQRLYVDGGGFSATRTYVLPLRRGATWPGELTADNPLRDWLAQPGVQTIEQANIDPTNDPAVYLFERLNQVRNLFRVPLG